MPDFGPALGAPQQPSLWDRLQGLGSNIAQWYNAQPSWIDQARAVKAGHPDWRNPMPTDDEINFATGMVGPQVLGIKAYHGSPHDFNAFDMSKIGTGEGAQSYGHGLYFAENPEVARDYRQRLAPNTPDKIAPDEHAIAKYQSDWDKLVQERRAAAGNEGRGDTSVVDGKMDAIHQKMVDDTIARNPNLAGRMYEVDINANPEHFLDWDKPLSEQHPKVQETLKGMGINNLEAIKYSSRNPEVANDLRQAGIPGIKYLDQGSRNPGFSSLTPAQLDGRIKILQDDIASGGGNQQKMQEQLAGLQRERDTYKNQTSNYVVFDDKLIDILKKYGIAGLGLGGAATMAQPPPLGLNQ